MNDTIHTSNHRRGLFITFEGGDGAGKTTHMRFLAQVLRVRGWEVVCLREPGGTPVGEKVRELVLDPVYETMSDRAELFLYLAARAQLVAEVIKPALERQAIVLCDRFADSTVAYQGYGRGLCHTFIERANEFACQGITPDRTILMLTGGDAACGIARATKHQTGDRIEQAGVEFHERVNAAFTHLSTAHPDRVRTVVSSAQKSQTARAVFEALFDLFPWMDDASKYTDDFFSQLDVPKEDRPSLFTQVNSLHNNG